MNPSPTLGDLQGNWKIVSVGQDGGKAPFFIPWLMKLKLEIKGDQYTKFLGERAIESGRLAVTPGSEFSAFDEHIATGEDSGKLHLGIIRWVGKKIEHLQGKVDEERPAGFPYGKDSMVGYAKMKRV